MALLTLAYALVVAVFLIYAGYFLWLSLLPVPVVPAGACEHDPRAPWPTVTVQLPIYNEGQVAARVISAACALEYPREALDIQVLDDSTDDTSEIIRRCVQSFQDQGVRIERLHRASREGYKAGNLAHGLSRARGELVAIFDADFVPEPGWLKSLVGRFEEEGAARLGFVQTRWRHLNGDASALTRAQASILDDDAQNQAQRAGSGLMSIFHGSAGLWRKDCITDAGGWSGRTLSEDLELSYRAQLAGWNAAYEATILVAAELPASMADYRRQQLRWAKGPTQVMRLLAGSLLRAPISWRKKADALLFLTSNVAHLLLVLLLLLKLPLLLKPTAVTALLDMLLALGIVGLCAPNLVGWLKGQRAAPLELLLQCGIALTGTRGVLAGLLGPPGGEFQRTPKGSAAGRAAAYGAGFDASVLGELVLLGVALYSVTLAVRKSQWFALPLLFTFVLGLGWVSAQLLWDALQNASSRS